MADQTQDKTDKEKAAIEDYLAEMKKQRGYLQPSMVFAANHDLDFLKAYDRLYNASLSAGDAFPPKYRELVAAGILAFKGFDPGVHEHLKRAIKLGATKQEAFEAMEATIAVGGWPTFGSGLRALIKIEEDEKKAG